MKKYILFIIILGVVGSQLGNAGESVITKRNAKQEAILNSI
jgi:hypothetical protein